MISRIVLFTIHPAHAISNFSRASNWDFVGLNLSGFIMFNQPQHKIDEKEHGNKVGIGDRFVLRSSEVNVKCLHFGLDS